jgi:plastocyanin
MRKLLATLIAIALLGGLAALGASVATGSGATAAATKSVTVADNSFSPHKFSIHKGTIVRWQWAADVVTDHTVTQADRHYDPKSKGFTSEEQSSGVYRHRFKETGTFYVVCTLHPTEMRMKIAVRD